MKNNRKYKGQQKKKSEKYEGNHISMKEKQKV